jgi:hypothetical protein
MRLLLHQSLKDLRQHRSELSLWLAVLALRYLLVAYPFDVALLGFVGDERGLGRSWQQPIIVYPHVALAVLYVGLTVAASVQLVHADSPARENSFWITRPLSRRSMWISKMLTAAAVFVALPVLADVTVITITGIGSDVLTAAVSQCVLEQLVLVLPAMALGAVTLDLAGFALSVLGLFGAGLIALIIAVSTLGPTSPAFTRPAVLAGLLVIIVAGFLVTAVQFVTRSRRLAIGVVALSVGLFAVAVRFGPVGATRRSTGPVLRAPAGRPFSAVPGSEAIAAGRRFTVLRTDCAGDACEVVVREARLALAFGAYPARVDVALVDPATGRPMMAPISHTVDKMEHIPTGPHVDVTWTWLTFSVESGLDPAQLAGRSLVPLVVLPDTAGSVR